MRKFFIGLGAFALAAGAVVAGIGYANADTNATACKWGSYPLCPRSVAGSQVVNGSLGEVEFDAATKAKLNKPSAASPFVGAYYSVAFYDNGDTNAGAIATVACKAATDTAISGGVQTLVDGTSLARNTPVSSSFPGRMDWNTNTPKANRLDGWVVQFGGNAGAVSDKDPAKVKVWALCVPGLSISADQTYLQSADK